MFDKRPYKLILFIVVPILFLAVIIYARLGSGPNYPAECGQLCLPDFWESPSIEDIEAELEEGANINGGPYGLYPDFNSPLHLAIEYDAGIEIIEFMLERGANVNASGRTFVHTYHESYKSHRTPLQFAVEQYNISPDVVRLLLEYGADPNPPTDYDADDESPLFYAARLWYDGHPAIIALLLEYGADINAKSYDGLTPFHRAMTGAQPALVELFLDNGADIHARTNYESYGIGGSFATPLHIAAEYNPHIESIAVLLDEGADVNAMDADGMTPLHRASGDNLAYTGLTEQRNIEVVKLLLAHEAKVSTENGRGDTPLHSTEDATVEPSPTIFGGNGDFHAPPFYGASSRPVEERIYDSDVVVRAALQSSTDGRLVFRSIEYLKGTGPTEFVVNAYTDGRNTSWDSREAVLFLSRPQHLASGASGAEFEFTNAHYKNPEGYTIDTLDPAWLPAEAIGASSTNPNFITDSGSVPGVSYQTISLAELRSKVKWVEGGEKTDDPYAYDFCIRSMLDHKKFYRDWEAYYGKPRPPAQLHTEIASGAGEGTLIIDFGGNSGSRYDRYWLTGQDADLFRPRRTEVPSNRNNGDFVTARPLPGGAYKFSLHWYAHEYAPCNFIPEERTVRSYWTISAMMREDTLHEAFFDPVTVGAAVAAGGPNGVLEPAAFTDSNVASATIRRIAWEADTVTLALLPHNGIAERTVDFIALDGSVSLSLKVAGAEVDTATGTLTWKVESQPWQPGDELMLRIH